MKEIGIKINSMVMVKKFGKIAFDMKGLFYKEKKMEKVGFIFLMVLITREIFEIINTMGMVN